MDYTKKEEILHAISHGLGAILSVIALVLMVMYAMHASTTHLITVSIFGVSLILLYTASTLYHAIENTKWKRIFKKIDHLCIYLLIAGTYTPFVLLGLKGTWGWVIFALIWSLAIVGFVFKFSRYQQNKVLSLSLYMLMGWLIVIAIKPLTERLSGDLLWYVALGGLCYTVGVFFYANKKIPYNHFIWHLFVLGGSTMHFLGVFLHLL
ncbi:MAG: hemolysin III family protein [Chitinophagales bacterium]|nr:hemolysin III family protein [Bacteroidota bacterium]MCB9043194.1 hemolysin III family protein [Chitinophagales bacterium]